MAYDLDSFSVASQPAPRGRNGVVFKIDSLIGEAPIVTFIDRAWEITSPDRAHGVGMDLRIRRQDHHALLNGLCDKKAVEGVVMDRRQFSGGPDVTIRKVK